MKIAVVHQLPLEIYPPAMNALVAFGRQEGWVLRVWSCGNEKGMPAWGCEGVEVGRPAYPGVSCGGLRRLLGFFRWHIRVALDLARWRPDAVLSVEPHSALAVSIYVRLLRGRGRIFIHHHEYYAPADWMRPGNRTSRICHGFEKRFLFERAEWVSQTNEMRLRLMREDHPAVTEDKARVWPNHPPEAWIERAWEVPRDGGDGRLRVVYLGSASFEDTFIREAAEWVVARPEAVSLHVCGHNIKADVWTWLSGLDAPNLTLDSEGCAYEDLPGLLGRFDAGLVLYKGNTLNFVHNVPNKAVEYLACGLEVWYPPEMEGMRDFHGQHPELPLREVDWKSPPLEVPPQTEGLAGDFPFTSERAIRPLLEQLG